MAKAKDRMLPYSGDAMAKCWCTMQLTSLRIGSACDNDAQVPAWHKYVHSQTPRHTWK
ncbi:hypothetical protein KY284_035935 [Solanum tuberosum]|nr:hypothetical protein KY284_035935 [Solanum tuberosum]